MTIADKFAEIHEDLEANVTRIYQRRDLLTAIDLVYHSVLQFRFQGVLVRKGWVEALVLGDTRCGKSETVDRLIQHYRAGELVTGENASFAGLVGGMQQTQKTWSITWGRMVLNDRRLIVIDEASGLTHEIISKLSGIRSAGIAEIIKIQTERTLARVRMIWMSNPRGRRSLRDYNSGVEAIQELVGQPEDIARFNFAITVASDEVPSEVINAHTRAVVKHKFDSDLCSSLVLWAWSRKPDDIIFSAEATSACLDYASDMGRRYSSSFPLVESAEQRIKLAQLSVATACRVFSTDDGRRVLVTGDHVEFVFEFLREIYAKRSMSYDLYSAAKFREQTLEDEGEILSRLRGHDDDFIRGLQDNQYFTQADVEDLTGQSREAARELVSFLVRKRCVRRGRTGYYKLPAFILLLRKMRAAKDNPLEDF